MRRRAGQGTLPPGGFEGHTRGRAGTTSRCKSPHRGPHPHLQKARSERIFNRESGRAPITPQVAIGFYFQVGGCGSAMAFRFRQSFRLLPGVRLNLGKRGASVSVGARGAHLTVGPKGMRTTVGLAGTGMSYTAYSPFGKNHAASETTDARVTLPPPDQAPPPLPATAATDATWLSGTRLVGIAVFGFLLAFLLVYRGH